MRRSSVPLLFAAFTLLAASPSFTPWPDVKQILDAHRDHLPPELETPDAAKWTAWSRREDKVIRARLQQGDLDSMVNLLLFGTSFTKQPRIRVEAITEASKSGVLRARVDDLIAGLANPDGNERLIFLGGLLRGKGIDPDMPGETGVFIYKNLQRVVEERRTLAERAEQAKRLPASPLDRVSLFHDRGVSLDTSIFPDYSIEQTLRDLKDRGVLREGQVARVAVVGPGLDFADKNEESAYDYYPQQTLQPFALYDSLVRLGLARGNAVSVTVFDISTRVIDHIQRARRLAMEKAPRKNTGYVVQLPRDVARPWPPELIAYWRSVGDRVGTPAPPIQPPQVFKDLETRAVRIRPEVVLACEPVDLNIVLQRLNLAPAERFDLIVGTNIFLYYDAFEQTLALENAGAMLKPGGLLLTNDRLPEVPGGSMRQAGMTDVRYGNKDATAHDAVGWYQRR
jgi:SAM-dependent methyltransferase